MPTARQTITVSPPNLDRTGFLSLDAALDGGAGLTSRDWLLAVCGTGSRSACCAPRARASSPSRPAAPLGGRWRGRSAPWWCNGFGWRRERSG